MRLFVNQNHALDAWFGKNYIVEADIKTPCCIIKVRSANCTKNNEVEMLIHVVLTDTKGNSLQEYGFLCRHKRSHSYSQG